MDIDEEVTEEEKCKCVTTAAVTQRLSRAASCQSSSSFPRLGSLYLFMENQPSVITFPLQTQKKIHTVTVHQLQVAGLTNSLN